MDKKAFKQRMQNLKAYRESNPGKTYLDWKVSAFADGGEVPPTNRPEPIERIPLVVIRQGRLSLTQD